MTLNLTTTQVQERLTVTVYCGVGTVGLPSVIIVVDGKAYAGVWRDDYPSFTYDIELERGPHSIYAQVTDSAGTVTTSPITFVMAYELTEYGIDVYSGDAKMDAIEPVLHDALLPDLPTLTFSCATLLTGNLDVVIRERGLRKYRFTIDTVGKSGSLYQYTCLAAESYALTSAIMALQTAYGSTADAIRLLVPSLNIVNADFLAQTTYPQLYQNITPIDVIKQLMIQALAQASVRNGNLYAFPLDIGGKKVTFSADIKSSVAGIVNFYSLGKYEINTGLACAATTTYQRVTMTGFFTYNPQGYNGDVCSLSFYGGYGSGVIPTVRNVEILVDGVQVLVSATEFTGSPSEYCMKDITAIAQQNMIPLWYHDPDYHMQRLDPLTGWQKDADIYDAVVAHYVVKQFPNPETILTLNDKVNWKDANGANALVSDVTQVTDIFLPVPSGALGMLKSVGNCSRTVSTLFRYFDRIRFNWLPVTAGSVTVSLQQDASNKLELTHAFSGQIGAGFVQTGSPGVSTDTVAESISCDDTGSGGTATKFVTMVTGNTTANCSYRVTLLDAGSAILWQDAWRSTISNTFEADVPTVVSQAYQVTTVRIEFTDLYLVGADYGVQCIACYITKQTYNAVGTHERVVSSTLYQVAMTFQPSYGPSGDYYRGYNTLPASISGQRYQVSSPHVPASLTLNVSTYSTVTVFVFELIDPKHALGLVDIGPWYIPATVIILETVSDYAWVSSMFVWSSAFNLFEPLDLAFVDFVRTGNPVNLQTIVLTFSGDNYVDTLVLVADNPLPVTVRAGTGQRAFTVTDDFGSEAGAQAYANGLLPIVSVAREQYTRDVSLATDLGVGDTVDGDGKNFTVRSVDYRQDGKTIAAGQAIDILMERLKEQARRLDSLERKV